MDAFGVAAPAAAPSGQQRGGIGQLLAGGAELVAGARRAQAVERRSDEPVGFELAEALGEDVRRDAVQVFAQFVESARAFEQHVNDEQRPAVPDEVERVGQGETCHDSSEARQGLLDTIENFAVAPPSKEEVERFKASGLKNIELAFNEPNTVALLMTDWVARGDWRLVFLFRDRMKKVTPEDVQRVAKTYLLQSNRTLGIFVPTEKPVRATVPTVSDEEIAQ